MVTGIMTGSYRRFGEISRTRSVSLSSGARAFRVHSSRPWTAIEVTHSSSRLRARRKVCRRIDRLLRHAARARYGRMLHEWSGGTTAPTDANLFVPLLAGASTWIGDGVERDRAGEKEDERGSRHDNNRTRGYMVHRRDRVPGCFEVARGGWQGCSWRTRPLLSARLPSSTATGATRRAPGHVRAGFRERSRVFFTVDL